MHKVEKWYSIYILTKGSNGGSLSVVKSEFETEEQAEKWLDENGVPKTYYVILKNHRRQ